MSGVKFEAQIDAKLPAYLYLDFDRLKQVRARESARKRERARERERQREREHERERE